MKTKALKNMVICVVCTSIFLKILIQNRPISGWNNFGVIYFLLLRISSKTTTVRRGLTSIHFS